MCNNHKNFRILHVRISKYIIVSVTIIKLFSNTMSNTYLLSIQYAIKAMYPPLPPAVWVKSPSIRRYKIPSVKNNKWAPKLYLLLLPQFRLHSSNKCPTEFFVFSSCLCDEEDDDHVDHNQYQFHCDCDSDNISLTTLSFWHY